MTVDLRQAASILFEYTLTVTVTAYRDDNGATPPVSNQFTIGVFDCMAEDITIPDRANLEIFKDMTETISLSTDTLPIDSRCQNYILSLEVKQDDGSWLSMYTGTQPAWFSGLTHTEIDDDSGYSFSYSVTMDSSR